MLAIARKEMIHLVRDRRSLIAALGLPAVLMILYGYAVDFDLKHVPFAVVDHDRTPSVRRIVESMASIEQFEYLGEIDSPDDAESLFERHDARLVVVFPPGFESKLLARQTARVQILIDGSDANTAASAKGYAEGAINKAGQALVAERLDAFGRHPPQLLDVRMRILFNPDLVSRNYLIPGLVALSLVLLSALLTSGVVVRERERGTFELLAASPVSAGELIVGKLLPYVVLAAIDVVGAIGVGWTVFGVVPQGSLLLLFGLSTIFVIAALSMGLFFSCVTKSQQVAMLLAFVSTMIPSFLISGFAFPVRNMPLPLQKIAVVFPVTHYLVVVRGIVLKGVGFSVLAPHVWAMAAFALVAMLAAVRKFTKTL
jgi:ABC-2 type transport system permease protein